LDNERQLDPAILSTTRKAEPSCKRFDIMMMMTVNYEKVLANGRASSRGNTVGASVI